MRCCTVRRFLATLEADPLRAGRFKRRALCQTLAGNNCDVLTITSQSMAPCMMSNGSVRDLALSWSPVAW